MRLITRTSAVLLLASATLAGCSSDPYSFEGVTSDLTPDMAGTTQRSKDIDKDMALVNDMNLRMGMDDLGRTFYTDQPSTLTPMPIVRRPNSMPR